MLRELITWILNTYLGKYLENFNPAQLSVALLSGEMVLENVPIRKDALRSFDLPLIACSGIIQKIKLQIPVRQFRSAPWCVTIEKLYVVIMPKDLNDWENEKEKQADLDYKLSQLEDSSIKWNEGSESLYYSSSYSSWLNYGSNLAKNVIENLELKVNGVHIRYEDTVTIPNFHFACGLKIDALTAQKRDVNRFDDKSTIFGDESFFKLVELKNFCAYWDRLPLDEVCSNAFSVELVEVMDKKLFEKSHCYVIFPLSAQAQCTHDKSPNFLRTKPRLFCKVMISEVILTLSDFQYTQIIRCWRGLGTIRQFRLNRLNRPACPVKGNSQIWWKYVSECCGFKYETEKEKWNKALNNIRYIKICRRLLTNPNQNLSVGEKQLKLEVEKTRSLSELKILRKVSFLHLHVINVNLKNQNENSARGILYQWFPYWWGWYRSSPTSNEVALENPVLISDQNPESLENEILSALGNSIENASLFEKDTVFGEFNFILMGGQIIVCSEHIITGETLVRMELNFRDLNLNVETRPRSGSYLLSLSLGSVCLTDRITDKTHFPDLIKPQFKKEKLLDNFSDTRTKNVSQNEMHEVWFQLQYEKNPIGFNTDYRLVIETKSLDIVYNICAYKWISEFLIRPLQSTDYLKDNEKLDETKSQFFKNWKKILQGDLSQRKTWSLEIDISAPQIIFVQDFKNKRTDIVLVDFGRFQLLKNSDKCNKRQMVEKRILLESGEDENENFMTPFSTPPGSQNSKSESPAFSYPAKDVLSPEDIQHTKLENAFHDKIYDKYSIDLTDLQVLIFKNGDSLPSLSLKNSSELHLLDRFSICLQLERRIISTSDPDYPFLTVCGTLPKLVAHINEFKIASLMNIIQTVSSEIASEVMLRPSWESQSCNSLEKFIEHSTEKDLVNPEKTLLKDEFQQSNLIVLQFVIDEASIEVQSCDRSIIELQIIGVKCRLDRWLKEVNIFMSIHGLLLVDAIQSFGPDFELLVASHRHVEMDSTSGCLRKNDFNVAKKKLSPVSLTKNQLSIPTNSSQADCADALIIVKIILTDSSGDSFATQAADINFNNLDIIANQETILEILSFINRAAPKASRKSNHILDSLKYETDDKDKQLPKLTKNLYNKCEINSLSLPARRKVTFNFHRLNILVMSSVKHDALFVGKKVGTLTMCETQIHASLCSEVSVYGSLGGLQILDLTQEGAKHPRILSVGKDPLTDSFEPKIENFFQTSQKLQDNNNTENNIDKYGQALSFSIQRNVDLLINMKMRMASVSYTHSPRFLHEINMCANEFKHYLQSFLRSLRKRATIMAIGLVQKSQDLEFSPEFSTKSSKVKSRNVLKINIDFIFDTPVVVLPRSESSSEVLVAHLGKISVKNNDKEEQKYLRRNERSHNSQNYLIDIRNINLFSLDTNEKNLQTNTLLRSEQFYSCKTDGIPILHDTVVKLYISKCSREIISIESSEIKFEEILYIDGVVTEPLQLSLCRKQYEQLIETINNAFKLPVDNPKELIKDVSSIGLRNNFDEKGSENQVHFNEVTEIDTISNVMPEGLIKKLSFSLPVFVIQLKSELDDPLIEITLRDFSVRYDQLDNYEILLQVSLRSALMEDLKCSIDSKYRQMVISSSSEKRKIRAQKIHLSSSCPNLVRLYHKGGDVKTGSLPENLEKNDELHESSVKYDHQNSCYFKWNINSCYPETPPSSPQPKSHEDNLVVYSSLLISAKCPTLHTQHQNRRQNSSIELNNLNLIVSIERWIALLDFVGLLSIGSEENTNNGFNEKPLELITEGNSDLEITVRSLNLVFVRKDLDLAKANVSNAFFNISKYEKNKTIEGRLGSISVIDLSMFGKLYHEKFLTSGSEALSFIYKSNNIKTTNQKLSSDATLRVYMSSVRYVYTKRFGAEITSFIKDVTQLQAPVIKRMKLTRNIKQAIKLGLDISAGSPIIIFPNSFDSNQVIVADLGEFSLKNSFRLANEKIDILENEIDNSDEILDTMKINLFNTNIFTAVRIPKTKSALCGKHGGGCLDMGSYCILKIDEDILRDNCNLNLQVERHLNCRENYNIPDVSVQGILSKLRIILNLEQCKLIHSFLVHNLGESCNDFNLEYSNHSADNPLNFETSCQEIANKSLNVVWSMLSINFNLDNVLVILDFPCKSDTKEKEKSVTHINFITSCLNINLYSDNSENVDLVSQEILISEKRYDSCSAKKDEKSNKFQNILEPIRRSMGINPVQFEISSRRRIDLYRYSVLLNNMRIIAKIDWMEKIQEYLNLYTKSSARSQSLKNSEPASISTPKNIPVQFTLNISESELVVVQKDDFPDTNAFILKTTAKLSYETPEVISPFVIDVKYIEVFSCVLGLESETALSILDPITLKIGLENNTVNIQVKRDLCIRLSYHDVKLFMKIIESLPSKSSPENIFFESEFSSKENLSVKNDVNRNSFTFHRRHEKWHRQIETANLSALALNAQCITIILIDDCKDADVPLLELMLSKLDFKYNFSDVHIFNNTDNEEFNGVKSLCCSGFLETNIAVEYYNRRLSGWEPIIETWRCIGMWNFSGSCNHSSDKLFLNLKVSSKDLLKINLTTAFLELWNLVHKNWIQDYYESTKIPITDLTYNNYSFSSIYRKRVPFVPFSLQNFTSENLQFKILLVQPGGITQTELAQHDMISNWIEVPPNKRIPFSFCSKSKLRHSDSHKLNLHQLLVQVDGWSAVGPLSIDKEGIFFRLASKSGLESIKTRIVFHISLMGSAQKLIIVRSALRIINQLDQPILINLDSKLKRSIQSERQNKINTARINPGKYYSIPLNMVESSIFFKPLFEESKETERSNFNEKLLTDSNEDKSRAIVAEKNFNKLPEYRFCNGGINWWTFMSEEVQEERVCQGYNNNEYNAIIVVRRDDFSIRGGINMPGHTITVKPPLKIINLLCCDLMYKISGQVEGRISSAKKANVYEISLNKTISISITLDNYKVSGQLTIPAGHLGIVEPKLNLLDDQNRSLYLRVSIKSVKGNGMEIIISCPFWIVNKTGLPLIFRQEGVLSASSGQFDEHEEAKVVNPLLFSFADLEAPPLLEMRLGNRYGQNNQWCQSFSLYKDIVYRTLKTADYSETFTIGITIHRGCGLYSRTNIVTLSSRFQIYNRTSHKLQFTQKCCANEDITDYRKATCTVVPGCHFPFHWPRFDQEPLLCVRLEDVKFCHWSSGIPINEAQSLYINIRNDFGEMYFLRLEIVLQGATYFLLFSDAYSLPPPIRFENYSNVSVKFHQCHHIPEWQTTVKPKFSLAYALDNPLGTRKIKICAPGGNYVDFPIQDLKFSHNLTYCNFIYIAMTGTFKNSHSENKYDVYNQNLVFGVKDRKVVLMRKCAGDRSQLWLINSNGQIEHEGSSPPTESSNNSKQVVRLVLDLEKAPNPMALTNIVVRASNKQREASQTWRFENGRLVCYSNMCAQVRDGLFGMRPGSEVFLGRIASEEKNDDFVPIEENFEIQKLRPGSGRLELTSSTDGPIRVIKIRDIYCDESIILTSDPFWKQASATTTQCVEESDFEGSTLRLIDQCFIKIILHEGVGISIISGRPNEEIAFITLQDINLEILHAESFFSLEFLVNELQIDNQILDSPCPVLLYTPKLNIGNMPNVDAFSLNMKIIPSKNNNIAIVEYMNFDLRSCVLYLEERFILKMFLLFGLKTNQNIESDLSNNLEFDMQHVENHILPANAKRYYFENFHIGSSQIRLSVITASKLSPEEVSTKKRLGLTLIKFEDALIEFEQFSHKHCFETMEVYLQLLKLHYKNQIKWHAAAILGSVDFLGNPLGFANDLSEGVSGLLFEGSVKSLLKNITHGISNSTAKLTETISDGLGQVVLDEQDKETRQKILCIPTSSAKSGEQLAAGFKGLGFGLLGGITSIVRYTYSGAQSDGLHGFISGLGKGIIGTVTKPIIGVLDLASKTANAVRETSRASHRILPVRKRLPRCLTTAPGGLVPQYSDCQSKGQQYLYMINRRNFSEYLIHYEPNLCNDQNSKLRLLVSTEYLRIFSRIEDEPVILLEFHLSEVLSCHAVTADKGSSDPYLKHKIAHYIEISTNLPKITRPRVRCRSEEMAELSARNINYAKRVYDDRELSLSCELAEQIT